MGWQEDAESRLTEARKWIALGAANERESMLGEIRALMPKTEVGGLHRAILTAMQAWLMARQEKAGVTVHRCTADDMEVPPEQT